MIRVLFVKSDLDYSVISRRRVSDMVFCLVNKVYDLGFFVKKICNGFVNTTSDHVLFVLRIRKKGHMLKTTSF